MVYFPTPTLPIAWRGRSYQTPLTRSGEGAGGGGTKKLQRKIRRHHPHQQVMHQYRQYHNKQQFSDRFISEISGSEDDGASYAHADEREREPELIGRE